MYGDRKICFFPRTFTPSCLGMRQARVSGTEKVSNLQKHFFRDNNFQVVNKQFQNREWKINNNISKEQWWAQIWSNSTNLFTFYDEKMQPRNFNLSSLFLVLAHCISKRKLWLPAWKSMRNPSPFHIWAVSSFSKRNCVFLITIRLFFLVHFEPFLVSLYLDTL